MHAAKLYPKRVPGRKSAENKIGHKPWAEALRLGWDTGRFLFIDFVSSQVFTVIFIFHTENVL